jgi:hypothetical protein
MLINLLIVNPTNSTRRDLSWEKLKVAQEILPFYGTQKFVNVTTAARHWCLR